MPKKKAEYGNDSISVLEGAERVRKRPGVIFGSDGLEGCQHAVFEILSNAIDEAREGFGDRIVLTRYLDRSIEVEDFGRGCPVDWNEKVGKFNWELVFCELYAGGKYDNLQGDNYEYSLGLNGLGACATQYAAEFMDVTVRREGLRYQLHFEKGELVGQLESFPGDKKKTGTRIHWRPDLEVFTDTDIPVDYYTDVLRRQAVVNAGLSFLFREEKEEGGFREETFFYERGILDYVEELCGEEAITPPQFWTGERKGKDRADKPEYKLKLSVSFCFSNRTKLIEHYHNSSWLEHGGAPEKAMRSAFLSVLDGWLKSNGKYTKAESKITWADIQEALVLVSNNFSTQTSYENQTKKAVTNKFIQEGMTEFLREKLQIYFIENPQAAERVTEQILLNKRSREAGEKARLNLKGTILAGNLDISNRVQKFVDCRTKDITRRELYIVEGDSALGACKQSRDADFQGIMPIRGKILNCLKADYGKIFKNEIITDLIKVLGCGVEVEFGKTKDMTSFSLKNLRWNKIVICTDADVDGFQIRTLILTMLYRLTPTLIQEGYVYIVESPLYEISAGDQTIFAYSDRDKNEALSKLEGKKYSIQRSKGLGENEPEMMHLTTMNPDTRRLIKVMPQDLEETAAAFDLLLGDNLAGRKEHIAEHGFRYLDMADIS